MRVEVEGRPPIDELTAPQLQSALRNLRSYGPSSFASLWLAEVLARIAQQPSRQLDDLLPWNWSPVIAIHRCQ